MQVSWLLRRNLARRYDALAEGLVLHGDAVAGLTSSTSPSSIAWIRSAASRAARASMPVPMYGASARTSGTACFCMFAPIRARLASSCSRNGISAVRDRHDLLRRHVHVVDLGAAARSRCRWWRRRSSPPPASCAGRRGWRPAASGARARARSLNGAVGVDRRVGLGDDVVLFLVGRHVDDLVGDLAVLTTLRYGLSMKPNSLTRAKVDRAPMRPMFGPSGVSIGHIRP